jgi:hypothetical protein
MLNMEESFTQKVLLVLLDKFVIGLIALAAGFYVSKLLEKYKAQQARWKELELLRDTTALRYLQRQIEELYSPVVALIDHSQQIYNIAAQKVPSVHLRLQAPTSDQEGEIWRYFVEQYFLPLNKQMAEIVRTKIYLLDRGEMPESFKAFLEHQVQYECLHKLWKEKGVPSDNIVGAGWPNDFAIDTRASLKRLMTEHENYARRLTT